MRQWQRWTAAACALVVSACASTGSTRLYEGEARAEAEVARIELPEQVQVLSVDGRDLPGGLLQRQQTVDLLPGEHVLTLRYVELFQFGAGDHEVVRSRPAALRFTAVAGARYRIDVSNRPANLDAARRYARDPAFNLVAEASGEATPSTAIKSYAEASLLDTLGKAFESAPEEPARSTHLDLLKDIWGRATPSERESFRAWLDAQGR